jgi:pimeloyl-ACP methyl ester carboxylesterase
MWDKREGLSESGIGYHRAGQGPTVLLLHGIPGSAHSWEGVAASLPAELDVIVPDLLGFGASERPTRFEALHAAGQAAAIEELLTELAIPRATVIGHDFGGPVALALARRRPTLTQALGLLATNVFPDAPIPFPLSTILWPAVGGVARRALLSKTSFKMMLKRGVGKGITPPDASTCIGDRQQQHAIATIFAGSLTHLQELYGPLAEQLHAMDLPALVGWGDQDPFFTVVQGERTAQAARTTIRRYPGAGHFLPHERPAEVAADILKLVTTPVPV